MAATLGIRIMKDKYNLFTEVHPDLDVNHPITEGVIDFGRHRDDSVVDDRDLIRCKKCGFINNLNQLNEDGFGDGITHFATGYGDGVYGAGAYGHETYDTTISQGACSLCGTFNCR